MKTLLTTTMSCTLLGLLFAATAHVAPAAAKEKTATSYECFTDDGYGRKRSCSSFYMQKRADANSFECFTDDGYGRKLPCSYYLKKKR